MTIRKSILSRSVITFLLFLFLFSCKSLKDTQEQSFTNFIGLGFTIALPTGFEYKEHQKLDKPIASYVFFSPKRADTFIRIDIYDAKYSRDLDKIVDENYTFFNNPSKTNETAFDKIRTLYFDYNASGEVGGRVYFMLYQGQMYRIILNWFKEHEEYYLPLLKESIQSITFDL